MSAFEDFEIEGVFTKKQIVAAKKRARKIAGGLKKMRTINDQRARAIFQKHYIENGRKWDTKSAREAFRNLMANRHALHERIARLVPEQIEPEFDSP